MYRGNNTHTCTRHKINWIETNAFNYKENKARQRKVRLIRFGKKKNSGAEKTAKRKKIKQGIV